MENASAITSFGKYVNTFTMTKLQEYLQKLLNTSEVLWVAGDTDSVVGDTIIDVNNEKITIEDYYNSLPNNFIKKDVFNEDYVKRVDNGDIALSMNTDFDIENKPIKYVMKHRVSKRMFKITVNDRHVIVTEDHSVMVKRTNELISVKPFDIKQTDKLIKSDYSFSSNFVIQDLDVIENDVYDIEVLDNHNFFANDILVHNSVYIQLHPLIKSLGLNWTNHKDKCVKVLDEFANTVIQPKIDELSEEICDYLNSYEQRMRWSREVISECFHPNTVLNNNTLENLFNNSNKVSDNIGELNESVYTLYNENVIETNTDYISRKYYSGKMVTIELEDNSVLTLTGEHIVYVDDNGTIKEIMAKDLKQSDNVIQKHITQKIASLLTTDYTGFVYDISVPLNRRFFLQNMLVHNCAIFVAKKRYSMKVWNSEGVEYTEPKIKITGLDSVRSSTPPWSQKFLANAYKLALDYDEQTIVDYVKKCRKEFNEMSINTIAIPRGVKGLEKYYDPNTIYSKGAQIYVKAALCHNELLKRKNIKHIAPILSGSKILYVPLFPQNPYKFEAIGFEGGLPPEFELDAFVDRNKIFEKGFLSALQNFLDAMNWSYDDRIMLDLF